MQNIDALLKATTLPIAEARILMMHVTNKSRIELITQSDYRLTNSEYKEYVRLEQLRSEGVPIAYLIGHREFFGLRFKVTHDVLIPRPETELLVELALQYAPPNARLLDMGTGSGAIAVSVAKQRPDLQVWASDVSPAALAVARHNAQAHGCKIQFVESDWYNTLPHMDWQIIVANPPYIVDGDPHLKQGDLRFEPINALTDHGDGLTAYRQIIGGAITRISKDGWLLLEHGYDQPNQVRAMLTARGFNHVQSWKDMAGIERVSGGCR